METSIKQAAMLAIIQGNPGITGPELAASVSDFIPHIQFPQHISRLRNRGLIKTERVHDGVVTIRVSLTKKGKEVLEHAAAMCKLVSEKLVKET